MGRHDRTLEAIFARPTRAGVRWDDAKALLVNKGAEVKNGNGSRRLVALNGVRAVFHEPHPQKEMCKGAVESLREFLEKAGVMP